MDRPPIEEMKDWYNDTARVLEAAGMTHMGADIIRLCDYALSLESEKAELGRRLDDYFQALHYISEYDTFDPVGACEVLQDKAKQALKEQP